MELKMASFETVNAIIKATQNSGCEVDVHCGRQCVDGKSYLGLASLIGNTVFLDILTDNLAIKDQFHREIEKNAIGEKINKRTGFKK